MIYEAINQHKRKIEKAYKTNEKQKHHNKTILIKEIWQSQIYLQLILANLLQNIKFSHSVFFESYEKVQMVQ